MPDAKGKATMLLPAVGLLVVIVTLGFAIWGSFQAEKLTRIVVPCSEEQLIKPEQS